MSLAELLIASALLLTVTGTVGTAVMRAQRTFRVQPEVADMQQRVRAGAAMLGRDLTMAGAGLASTAQAGPLVRSLPPVAPYRRGQLDDGAAGLGFYRADAVSVVSVSDTVAEADILHVTALGGELLVDVAPNCGDVIHERVCGFVVGMRVILLDAIGRFDLGTVIGVTAARVRVQTAGTAAGAYDGGAVIAAVTAPTYFLKPDTATGAFQLMRYDGFQTDRPVIDNVVAFRLEYFGDPAPPRMLGALEGDQPARPVTTYGPPPPPEGIDDTRDSWPAGENCLFGAAPGGPASRLPQLAPGPSPVLLPPAILQDGPWCPDDLHAVRYDADLLRIRRVRVTLRVQVAVAAMRGPAGRLFARGGSSTSAELFAPDQQVVFDVTPRNLGVTP